MSRIILIVDTDLNKDAFYSEIQLALEIKPEEHSECIGMIFLTFREIKIAKANLIEFPFVEVYLQINRIQTAIKEVIKSPMRSAPRGKK